MSNPDKRNHQTFFCSWSGGKDSSLSLYKATLEGYVPRLLITMCAESVKRSSAHALSMDVLRAQAESMDIALVTVNISGENYRDKFIEAIQNAKIQDAQVKRIVFGDIDIEDHIKWEKEVCFAVGLDAYLPLWKMKRKMVIKEFLGYGFKAMIIAVDASKLGQEYLGRIIDEKLIEEFGEIGIDLCGENGEYHSVVFDGPIFRYPIVIEKGNIVLRDGRAFLDVLIGAVD